MSPWLAIQGGRWHSTDAISNPTPQFDFESIDNLLQEIIPRESEWAEHFAANAIRPFLIVYEDFVQVPLSCLLGILNSLDIDQPTSLELPEARFQRLSKELTEAWVERFREEKQVGWWAKFW